MLKRLTKLLSKTVLFGGKFLKEVVEEQQMQTSTKLKFTFDDGKNHSCEYLTVSHEFLDMELDHLSDERFWELICEEIIRQRYMHV